MFLKATISTNNPSLFHGRINVTNNYLRNWVEMVMRVNKISWL